MTTPLTCRNYINGNWLPAQSGATLESRNPADWRKRIATFPRSGATDVDAAVAAARRAYLSWRLVPAPVRAELIYRVGELLLQFDILPTPLTHSLCGFHRVTSMCFLDLSLSEFYEPT